MYVNVYMCVCICMYLCIHIYSYTHLFIYSYIHTLTHTHTYTYVCIHIYIIESVRVCVGWPLSYAFCHTYYIRTLYPYSLFISCLLCVCVYIYNLSKSPDTDVLKTIVLKLQKRVESGVVTLLIKVKVHEGDPLNEESVIRSEFTRLKEYKETIWDDSTDRTIHQCSVTSPPPKTKGPKSKLLCWLIPFGTISDRKPEK